jgi:NAD-dependent SIR2 family protein deacetylase
VKSPCDLVLVIGTSTTFDYIRRWALDGAAKGWLIEVNTRATPLATEANRFIRGKASVVLVRLLESALARDAAVS